jgi:anthranilate phosphoribosyltransferase
MSDLVQWLEQIRAGHPLSELQASAAATALASAEVPAELKGEFLVALAEKGETGAEIAAFARAFREMARDPDLADWSGRAIDVCGTGGDHAGSFNVSTATVFVLAAAGVPVLKHGNRSITSRCGSADLLEALGIRLEADLPTLRRSMEQLGFAFLFAPAFHPAFKEIGPVRRALAAKGQRTIFNILGPLINPARPAHQLLGVFSEALAPVLAEALHGVGVVSGMVVHGRTEQGGGVDELTTATVNRIVGAGRHRGLDEVWTAERFGLAPASLEDLAGGDREENLAIFHRLLDGDVPQGLIETVCLNAGAGLFLAGRAADLKDGIGLARDLLLGGAVKRRVAEAREFYSS